VFAPQGVRAPVLLFRTLKGACFSTGMGKPHPIKLLQFRISPHTDFSLLRRPQVERKACGMKLGLGLEMKAETAKIANREKPAP